MKIEKLTPEQEARFPEFVEKWKKIGLCTEPADREKAEKAINLCYEIAGLAHPEKIIWCDSPLSMCISHSMFLNNASVKDSVGDSVGDSVLDSVSASVSTSVWASVKDSIRDSVRDSVKDSVRDSVGNSIRDSVRDSVKDSVRDSVGNSIRDSVWDSVRVSVGVSVRNNVWDSVKTSVWASVWASVRASVWDSVYGQHDSHWLAFYDFFKDVCGLTEQTEKLRGLWDGAVSHGWWIPREKVCFVSERHNICNLNKDGVIHCEDGAAIAYPDGFEIYAWNGTVVPKEWIMEKDKLNADTVLKCDNIEQRSAGCEIIGWAKILKELNAVTIEKDEDPMIGELVECEIPEVGKRKFVRVLCGTGREFALSVPNTMKTALEANAWTYGIDSDIYKPEVRT